MPLTGTKGYGKKKVASVASKVVDVASGATPATAVVRGGKAAARWALDKYRAYSAAKKAKEDAAAKAKTEKRADELYGKGTDIKAPEPKPVAKKPKPKQTGVVASVKTTAENLRKKREALKEASKPN